MKFRWETPSSCMSLLSQGGCRYLSWLLYFWFTFALLFLSWLLYSTDIWFYDPYVIYISMILWITNMIVLILLICCLNKLHTYPQLIFHCLARQIPANNTPKSISIWRGSTLRDIQFGSEPAQSSNIVPQKFQDAMTEVQLEYK